MRFLILPSARTEVFTLVGYHERIDEVLLWHPKDFERCLTHYHARARALCTATELTAGIVDKLLLFSLLSVTLVYLFVRLRLPLRQLKFWLWMAVVATIANLLVVSGVVYILSVYPEISDAVALLVRGLSAIGILAYSGLCIGIIWMLLRRFMFQGIHKHARVNSS